MNKYKFSITVEASLSFSITIFVLTIILGSLFVIESSKKIINKIENDSRNLSYYQWIKKNIDDENKIISFDGLNDNNQNNTELTLNNDIDKNNVSDSIKKFNQYWSRCFKII